MQSLTRLIAVMALLLLAQGDAAAPARAADGAYQGNGGGRVVELGIGKSYVVDLPGKAAEVLVADPKIANAVVRSARKAYVIGIALGETDIIFFDAEGRQIESLAVSVARDLSPIRNNIHYSLPDATISAKAVGESVVLTGSVTSPADAKTAVDIAANLVGGTDKVVNALAIEDRDQVMLKVSIVEMSRETAKKFGVRWTGNGIDGNTLYAGGSSPNPEATDPSVLRWDDLDETLANGVKQNVAGNGIGILHTWATGALMMNIDALESKNMLRTLAEPNLTAISGEKAEFLAGGEFPIQVQTDDGISIEYKKFGVGLGFTPVVLSNGRISLQLTTEVSERVDAESLAINVRRATTTVELPSGGSLALAGLLQENSRQALEGLPGLINLPVLGSLFRSRAFQHGQSELVVIVTPYIAKHASASKFAKPDDGFETPTDVETILLGRLNKIYAPAMQPTGNYKGPIGHIVE